MRRKVFSQIVAFLFFIALAGPAVPLSVLAVQNKASEELIPNMRVWKDRSGRHSLEAELVGYENSIVELKKEDGTTISIPLKELSNSDKWYVRKEIKSRRSPATGTVQPVKKREAPEKTEPTPRTRLTQKELKDLGRQIKTKRLFGLEWHENPESFAAASKLSRSEKPVMWFRVLGDLEGFM